MREFFERELKRYQNRRANLAKKLGNPENERLTQELKFVKTQMARDRGLFADKMKNLMNEIKQLRTENQKFRLYISQLSLQS
jgi:predicted  nucleic acid-binding Zn-ribbon protein